MEVDFGSNSVPVLSIPQQTFENYEILSSNFLEKMYY